MRRITVGSDCACILDTGRPGRTALASIAAQFERQSFGDSACAAAAADRLHQDTVGMPARGADRPASIVDGSGVAVAAIAAIARATAEHVREVAPRPAAAADRVQSDRSGKIPCCRDLGAGGDIRADTAGIATEAAAAARSDNGRVVATIAALAPDASAQQAVGLDAICLDRTAIDVDLNRADVAASTAGAVLLAAGAVAAAPALGQPDDAGDIIALCRNRDT